MYYFVGLNIGRKLPGIEHSQIKRLKLFNQFNVSSKILTMNYSSELYRNTKIHNISSFVISMYDYFQQSIGDFQYNESNLYEQWQKDDDITIVYVKNNNDLKIYYKEDYLCYAHFHDPDYEFVDYVNYFDSPYDTRRKVKRDIYDVRGFLSSVRILGEQQQPLMDSYYSPCGEEKIVIYRDLKGKISRIILKNYKGRTHYFNTLIDWQAFFLDEINEEGTIFFSDRSRFLMKPLEKMKTDKIVVPIFHSIHLRDELDNYSDIRLPYQAVFNHLPLVDGIVVSTKEQCEAVSQRVGDNAIVKNIPVGTTPTQLKITNNRHRNPYKIISVARYSEEKQLEHQLRIIKDLASDFPAIELHLFGYGDASTQFKEEKQLKKFVKDNGLDDYVFFRGYQEDLEAEYQTSGLMLLTSKIEGFCLALLEATQQGVPCIAYDIKYGPNEIIKDGYNGYLVEKNNIEKMKNRVRELLEDTERQKTFSVNAYAQAQAFNEEKIMGKWLELIEDVQRKQSV